MHILTITQLYSSSNIKFAQLAFTLCSSFISNCAMPLTISAVIDINLVVYSSVAPVETAFFQRRLHMPLLVHFPLQHSYKWSKKSRRLPSWALIITCNGLARCWSGTGPVGQVAMRRRMAWSSINESTANWIPICWHAKCSEPLKSSLFSHSVRRKRARWLAFSFRAYNVVGLDKGQPDIRYRTEKGTGLPSLCSKKMSKFDFV